MIPFADDPIGILGHHTLTADNEVLPSYEAIRYHHVKVKGWDDIGYHWVIEYINGKLRIYTGRSSYYQGAHCKAVNRTHLGIAIVGNFDVTEPPREVLEAFERLCRGLFVIYPHMDHRSVGFHCDHDPKSCPGDKFPRAGFILSLAGEDRPEKEE